MRAPAHPVAIGAVVLHAACLIAATALFAATPGRSDGAGLALTALPGAAFTAIGALIAIRRSENRVGALCLTIGAIWAFGFATGSVGEWGVDTGHLGAAAEWLAWLGNNVWLPAVGLMGTHLPLRLPDGRLPSPRWRWFSRVCTGGIVFAFVVIATDPEATFRGVPSPAGTDAFQPLAPLLLVLAACLVAAIASVFHRYRRTADGRERLQIRCIALGAAIFVGTYLVALTVSIAFGLEDESTTAQVLQSAALLSYAAIPIAIGVAILRHRLYDIDRVINRAVVYGSLTAVLAGAYVALVLLLGLALSPLTEQSDLAIAVSTLAVAALFQPVRRWLQRGVDRRFFRHRYDAARTLEGFSARLQAQTDLDALSADLASVVRQAMQPAHVSLWLRGHDSVTVPVTMPGHQPDTTKGR